MTELTYCHPRIIYIYNICYSNNLCVILSLWDITLHIVIIIIYKCVCYVWALWLVCPFILKNIFIAARSSSSSSNRCFTCAGPFSAPCLSITFSSFFFFFVFFLISHVFDRGGDRYIVMAISSDRKIYLRESSLTGNRCVCVCVCAMIKMNGVHLYL